ncbi:hypothetical protein GIB67_039268 [Kingdonia uniflora]|uniref:Uncharacterized protein n=1 Tax=Kingdonia uniflora TaxID=39325 RepID=A0A7J7MM88_9MAGN|nr:hypothetical protein GIB67_039268 [Kingdonia uniflora]
MTFRQVVLRRIWSFELVLFSPGAKRNMGDLENQREDEALFTLSSSDERVISVLAEAVCMCVLESTERDICENSLGTTSNFFSHWFQKPKTTASKDLSVSIHKISDDQIIENAKKYLATFNRKENYGSRKMTKKNQWWTPSTYSKLEKIGGSEFGTWTNKFVLAYRLQVDADKLENLKCEGWKKSAENRWEALLTHSQMVGLAGILDMFYEDRYTLPADKILSSGVVADFTNVSTNKKGSSVWKLISITIASGLLMGFISIIAQLPWTRLNKVERSLTEHCSVSLSETHSYKQSMETTELEGLCIMIVKKIKDAVGWPGDITTEINVGAWTGELPSYLRRLDTGDIVQEVVTSNEKDAGSYSNGNVPMSAGFFTSVVSASDISNTNVKTSVQDIASYQVVLSKEGHIIGFQPTSRVAVNHWANNPLAKELYKGRKLSPGLLEPGLKIPHPDKIVLIELLMSVNPDSWFALARPVL